MKLELIDKLGSQAQQSVSRQQLVDLDFLEKFAELIVRECLLELADARLEFVWDKETDEVFKQTVSKIKEHFGVK